jgi:hypothetical protein
MNDATHNTNRTEADMDTIIERFEELLRSGEAKDQREACMRLIKEGVHPQDAARVAWKAFGGKGAVTRVDSSITRRNY